LTARGRERTIPQVATFIALLRGINVGGHRPVPMTELRALADQLGYGSVQSYIQSGNLLFTASGKADAHAQALEQAIAKRFGFPVDVVVRSSRQWQGYLEENPFPAASAVEPKAVMLALCRKKPKGDAASLLQERATGKERVELQGDALWIHYGNGFARTKLTPVLLDRLAGSPVTMRNWRTVQQLHALATAT
jgi:uncharacterized protein (DUF1697 family)